MRFPEVIHRRNLFVFLLGMASLQTACGGSSSGQSTTVNVGAVLPVATARSDSSPLGASAQLSSMSAVPVKFSYTLPLSSNAPEGPHSLSNATYTGYTSTAAPISISINITPFNGSTSNYGGSCTANASGTTGICTVAFTTVPGPTLISGTLSESGNIVANFSNTTIILPGATNTLDFTANPVVSSITTQLGASTVNAGTAADISLVVNAKDANGNIIAGSLPYRDTNGNPVILTLSVQHNQAGGGGTLTLQGSRVLTTPGQTTPNLHYDGKWLASSSISVSSSSAIVTTPPPAVLTTIPRVFEYTVAGSPLGISAGPDGNIWFVEFSGNQIGKRSTNGTGYTTYGCAGCISPNSIIQGLDGNLWYTDAGGGHLDKITTKGVASIVSAVTNTPEDLALGSDGNVWTSSSSTFAKTTVNGTTQTFAAGNSARGVGLGPDGNLWYLSSSNTHLFKVSTAGVILANYTIASDGPASDGIVTGPDGNLWFVNNGSNLIERVTLGGSVTSFPLQLFASPRDIVVGPDSELWFTEQETNSIGRITTGGALTEYGSANGISLLSAPVGITLGPDGNIWFAESGTDKIAKFVL
jgi:streptogramin lyase